MVPATTPNIAAAAALLLPRRTRRELKSVLASVAAFTSTVLPLAVAADAGSGTAVAISAIAVRAATLRCILVNICLVPLLVGPDLQLSCTCGVSGYDT